MMGDQNAPFQCRLLRKVMLRGHRRNQRAIAGDIWGLTLAGLRVNANVQERGYGAPSVVTEATGSVAVRRFAGAEAKT